LAWLRSMASTGPIDQHRQVIEVGRQPIEQRGRVVDVAADKLAVGDQPTCGPAARVVFEDRSDRLGPSSGGVAHLGTSEHSEATIMATGFRSSSASNNAGDIS
jgi:hypothetical protein